jgi:two-component system response regulator HydG
MGRVLVADDEVKLGRLVAEMLELDKHSVTRVQGGRAALVELAARPFDVVVTDLRMADVDGLVVLREARARRCEAIVMTAFGSAESAVQAMKSGAADYLLKPFSMDELRLRVRRLCDQQKAHVRSEQLVRKLTPSLVARSAAMRAVLETAERVASSDATVLLLGESGTGKTQLARYIHYRGARASLPLIEVHCAALPETLLEAELFGFEKGAFTGAVERKQGHLSVADGGSVFLDEIGEITPATQVKLLRFLQDHELVPVGSTRPTRVDVRVIAATNSDLDAALKSGAFREDLYYRLNVFSIIVPPLRDRRDDVLPLAEQFLASRGVPAARLSQSAREDLLRRAWPGNVRELENALERALILAGDEPIAAEHVRGVGRAPNRAAELLEPGFRLDDFERDLIDAALERAGGNKTAASRLLGITRRRLYSLLQSHALEQEDESSD